MVQRFANWNSKPSVKAKLQAALYNNREQRVDRKVFTPLDMSQLLLWSEAIGTKNTVLDGSSNVSTWYDKAHDRNKINAVNAITANRPNLATTIGGKNALNFATSTAYLSYPNFAPFNNLWAGKGYVALVFRANNIAHSGYIIGKTDNSTYGWRIQSIQANSEIRFTIITSGTFAQFQWPITMDTPYVMEVIWDSNNLTGLPTVTLNGALPTVSTLSSGTGSYVNDTATNLALGNSFNGAGNVLNGLIGAVVITKKVPDAKVRLRLRKYLANLYGITTT